MACVAGWKPALHRGTRVAASAFRWRDQKATVAGLVVVGLEQRRAARSERPVGEHLDGAHGQSLVRIDGPRENHSPVVAGELSIIT